METIIYIKDLLIFLSYPIMGMLCLLYFVLLGYLFFSLLRKSPRLIDSIAVGLALWIPIGWLGAFSGPNIRITFIVLTTFCVLALLIQLLQKNKRNYAKLFFGKNNFVLTVFSVFAGTWLILPELIALSRVRVFGGSAIVQNADIGIYSLGLKSILHTGFTSSPVGGGPIANLFSPTMDLSNFVIQDFSGAVIFLAAFGSIVSNSSWIALTPSLIAANAMLWIALYTLQISFFPQLQNKRYLKFLAPTVGLLIPLQAFIAGNFFLAQTLGMTALIAVAANLLLIIQGKEKVNIWLALIGWLIVGIYVYSPLGFLSIVISGLVLAVELVRRLVAKTYFKIFGMWISGTFVAVGIITFPAITYTFSKMLTTAEVVTGWSMSGLTSLGALIDSTYIWVAATDSAAIISWLILLIVVIFAIWVFKVGNIFQRLLLCAAIFVFALFWTLLSFRVGWGEYRNWKFLSYFLSPFFVLFLSGLILARKFEIGAKFLTLIIAGSVIVAPLAFIPIESNTTSRGLVSLSKDPNISNLNTVNILVKPIFDTMLAGAIVQSKQAHLVSPSYVKNISLDGNSCTLVDGSSALVNFPGALEINESYFLIPLPQKCNSVTKSPVSKIPVNMISLENQVSNVSSLSELTFDSTFFGGWNGREDQGVWSESKAYLLANGGQDCVEESCKLRLEFSTFGATALEPKKVIFTVDADHQHEYLYTDDNYHIVEIPISRLSTSTIQIDVPEATSPMEANGSVDRRILGVYVQKLALLTE